MDRKLFNFKNVAMGAVFTLIAFVGFSAFKSTAKVTTKAADLNFTFGSGQETDADSYSTIPPTSCEGSETVCVILAPDSSGHPQMSAEVPNTGGETVQQRILDALSDPLGPQTNETVLSLKGR